MRVSNLFSFDRLIVQGYSDDCQDISQVLLRLRPYCMRGSWFLYEGKQLHKLPI